VSYRPQSASVSFINFVVYLHKQIYSYNVYAVRVPPKVDSLSFELAQCEGDQLCVSRADAVPSEDLLGHVAFFVLVYVEIALIITYFI